MLTVAHRSCLLRAARVRLSQLEADYDACHERGDIGAPKNVLAAEIKCVREAINWLWRCPAVDE